MQTFIDPVTKFASKMACCFRSLRDPEMCSQVSGAVMYPDQLKSRNEGGPKYVIPVGSPPYDRSTVDFSPHSDFMSPYGFDARHERIGKHTTRLSKGDPIDQDSMKDWFPMFSCGGYNSCQLDERQLVSHQGYGSPWRLVGSKSGQATIFRCVRTDAEYENTDRFRVWRDGRCFTIKAVEDYDACLDDPADPWTPRDMFQVIFFEGHGEYRRTAEERRTGVLNSRLRSDEKWRKIVKIIREELDPQFGKYEDYITTLFLVAAGTETIKQMGSCLVYRGFPNEDVECAAVEAIYRNYMIPNMRYTGESDLKCAQNHDYGMRGFAALALDSQNHRQRLSGPPDVIDFKKRRGSNCGKRRDTSVNATNLCKWEKACDGVGLGLASAADYKVTVVRPKTLRLGIDLCPAYLMTRETSSIHNHPCTEDDERKMYEELVKYMEESRKQNKREYNPEDGCDCDLDEDFVSAVSLVLKKEASWLSKIMADRTERRRSISVDDAVKEFIENGLVSDNVRNHMWHGIPVVENPKKDRLSWYVRDAGGWINKDEDAFYRGRSDTSPSTSSPKKRRKYEIVHGSKRSCAFYTGATKPTTFGGIVVGHAALSKSDTGGMRARSNMDPWDCRHCYSVPLGRTFHFTSGEGRRNQYRPRQYFTATGTIERFGRKRLAANVSDKDEIACRSAECCFLVFVGEAMWCACRTFFSMDEKNTGVLVDEMAATVKAINSIDPLSRMINGGRSTSSRNIPFVLIIAAARCDVVTGSRNCYKVEMAMGSVAEQPDKIFHAMRKIKSMCMEVSAAGIYNLRNLLAVPTISTTPYRCVLKCTEDISDCSSPTMVSCASYSSLPFPCEEVQVFGSEHCWRIPSQKALCRSLAMNSTCDCFGDCLLGLYYPVRGMRLLNADIKRRIGEYCYRLRRWLLFGEGFPHFDALRKIVPLCDCFISDFGMQSNFFGYGILIHLHFKPTVEREKLFVKIITRIIEDSGHFADSSLYVDLKNY